MIQVNSRSIIATAIAVGAACSALAIPVSYTPSPTQTPPARTTAVGVSLEYPKNSSCVIVPSKVENDEVTSVVVRRAHIMNGVQASNEPRPQLNIPQMEALFAEYGYNWDTFSNESQYGNHIQRMDANDRANLRTYLESKNPKRFVDYKAKHEPASSSTSTTGDAAAA
ncbi:hypothetical protein J3R30DRAFT_2713533 [Lentinula aciculospora]|uniref:Uncharacterized protein n=1 Tax=Lentinula aciculospora TaxID=153920 RepID=A0A9W9DNR4_9AGAR|nr:hypothetical protein J3R30DRAFT_2713533 [Lentinula aciculospora]